MQESRERREEKIRASISKLEDADERHWGSDNRDVSMHDVASFSKPRKASTQTEGARSSMSLMSMLGDGLRRGASFVGARRNTASATGGSSASLPVDIPAVLEMVLQRRLERQMEQKPWYVLDPRGFNMACWDVVTSIALVHTAAVTPFEVGLLDNPTLNTLFVVNRLVDLVFIIDLCVQFFLMRRKRYTDRSQGDASKKQDFGFAWETDVKSLARHYLKTWFLPDLLTVLPGIFDVIFFFVSEQAPTCSGGTSSEEHEQASRVTRSLRLLRLFRLFKISRLLRGSRILRRIERRNAIDYTTLSFFLILCKVSLAVHWIACGLTIVPKAASWKHDSRLDSWLATHGLCRPDGYDSCGARAAVCAGAFEIYINALYWSFGMVTGFASTPAGGPFVPHFSDVEHAGLAANATSVARLRLHEQASTILFSVLGAAIWAYVTARLVELIINSDPATAAFRQHMSALNRFCEFHQLPHGLTLQLREYVHEKRDVMREQSNSAIATSLSTRLAEETAWHIHKTWLVTLPLMSEANKAFLSRVALQMEHTVYAPKERPPLGYLYCIFQGVARFDRSTLGPGDSFGERDVLLKSESMREVMRSRHQAFAVTYLHLHFIGAKGLESLQDDFPRGFWKMRKWVLKQAVLEWVRQHYLKERSKAYKIFTRHDMRRQGELPLEVVGHIRDLEGAHAQRHGREVRPRASLEEAGTDTLTRERFVRWWLFGAFTSTSTKKTGHAKVEVLTSEDHARDSRPTVVPLAQMSFPVGGAAHEAAARPADEESLASMLGEIEPGVRRGRSPTSHLPRVDPGERGVVHVADASLDDWHEPGTTANKPRWQQKKRPKAPRARRDPTGGAAGAGTATTTQGSDHDSLQPDLTA